MMPKGFCGSVHFNIESGRVTEREDRLVLVLVTFDMVTMPGEGRGLDEVPGCVYKVKVVVFWIWLEFEVKDLEGLLIVACYGDAASSDVVELDN